MVSMNCKIDNFKNYFSSIAIIYPNNLLFLNYFWIFLNFILNLRQLTVYIFCIKKIIAKSFNKLESDKNLPDISFNKTIKWIGQ